MKKGPILRDTGPLGVGVFRRGYPLGVGSRRTLAAKTLVILTIRQLTSVSPHSGCSPATGRTEPYGGSELGFEKGGRLLGPLNPQDVLRSIGSLDSPAERGANELERIRGLLEELLGVKTIVDESSGEVRVVDEKD